MTSSNAAGQFATTNPPNKSAQIVCGADIAGASSVTCRDAKLRDRPHE